jgi:hypothetical protein
MHCLDLGTNLRSFLLSYSIRINIIKMVDNTDDFIFLWLGFAFPQRSRFPFCLGLKGLGVVVVVWLGFA